MISVEERNYYTEMILTSLTAIIERSERNPDYPYIDTKFSTLTGKDFDLDPAPKNAFRTRKYIYSWIQGRGLEALCSHYNFVAQSALPLPAKKQLQSRILRLTAQVSSAMEKLRKKAGGRLWFVMTDDGKKYNIENGTTFIEQTHSISSATYSDIFYYKGLYAAAKILHDSALLQISLHALANTFTQLLNNDFRTDQQAFDPNNPVTYTPEKILQGPRMVALLGLSRLIENNESVADWADYAAKYIELVLDHHVVSKERHPGLIEYGFIEAVDRQMKPFISNRQVLGDPGHAGEFAGLAGRCLRLPEFQSRFAELTRRSYMILPQVLKVNFALGYNPAGHGIFKSVDLYTGAAINSDMPWWNLPETMRAAAYMWRHLPESGEIFSLCSESFRHYFINKKVNMMAYQNRNSKGDVIQIVPATPDADPGYHTNISMIDVLESGWR